MYGSKSINTLITKAKALVRKIKTFSIAINKLFNKAGKVLNMDNTTHWNNTYLLMQHLLDLKNAVLDVLLEIKKDNLQHSV